MEPYLKDRLPIWEVAADHIVTKAGDSTLAFVLIKPEIFTQSAAELQELHRTWVKALHTLPPNTIVHIQDWYWQTEWKADLENGDPSFLSRSSDLFHHERPWMNHCCYLYITRRPARRAVTAGTSLLQKHLVPQDTLSPTAAQEFKMQVSQFIRILTDGGALQCRQLQTEELVSSPGKPGLIEQYCQLNMPGEEAFLNDVRFWPEGMAIGSNCCSLYTLADAEHLPAQCSPDVAYTPYSNTGAPLSIGFASPLGLLLPCNHIYNQYILIEDSFQVRKKLEARSRRMYSLSAHSRENALNKQALDEFLNETTAYGKLMVKAHFNIFSWACGWNPAERIQSQVGAAIAKLGATPHFETEGRAQIWCAGIPGNAADLPPYEMFDILAEQAVCLLTPDTNYRESISTYGVRLGCRLHGRPLQVDLSDLPMRTGQISNRNKFVLGGSGSGKSFFTNHLVRSYYEQGAHVVVVDIGNSYQGLCSLVEGYYFTYKEDAPLSLNPFWMPAGEVPDIEKKESLKALLLAIWKKEDEPFLRSEYVTLSNALQLYYEKLAGKPDLFPCFDTFYEFLRDEFAGILAADKVQRKDFDVKNFLYVLRPFYKGGEYDFLLNARQQLDLKDQRFIVFELDNIKETILFPIVTLVIAEVFIGKMRKLPGIRKVILIEEAWKAIARQGMSEYIKYLFKTVRKFFGEAIVVTQEVEDIISSPVVKQAILNNADCKILLDQSKFRNRFDQLQHLLGLTDQDKAMVLSLNQDIPPGKKYKEVFISLGSSCSKVYRTEVSGEEYLTYTTEEKEKLQVQKWARKHGSLKKGIAALADSLWGDSVGWLITGIMVLGALLAPSQKVSAQLEYPIAAIIQMGVKKVIVATDLAIQRLQTATIGLQSAQKTLENAMQLDRLTDISDWLRRQKELFADYYQELWEIKNAFLVYQRVKDMVEQEVYIGYGLKKVLSSLRRDPHFSVAELEQMGKVYGGLLDRSVRIAGELTKIITGFVTRMEDGDRLEIIDRLGEEMDRQQRDLLAFTQGNILLSLQRSKSRQEIEYIKTIYNIY